MNPGLSHAQTGHHTAAEDSHLPAVKGILKRATTAQSEVNAPRLKWDEENLIITEAQKDSTMKIDEPKTPFIHYDHELDRVLDADEVFRLNGPRKKQAALAHTPPVPSYFKGLANEDEDDGVDDDDREPNDEPEEWQSSDEEGEQESENKAVDHDKFARLRAKHYNMREAVKLGHALSQDEDEDEDKDEEAEQQQQHPGSGSRSRSPHQTFSSGSDSADLNSRKEKDDDEDSLDMEL
ncbi:hypothetical protein EC957_001939 [Mortierella hygrophila]|uniref:Protein phosphatase inhibitor 2 n=1 Tax=Mortierella hygrophila TaxID=979708 RepID=A0A9P6F4Y5_9FUNG|nr:hypothetical protein EC957_001939 [Mortierella hygrophila]